MELNIYQIHSSITFYSTLNIFNLIVSNIILIDFTDFFITHF
jgi:hypothetical protein